VECNRLHELIDEVVEIEGDCDEAGNNLGAAVDALRRLL
jgi:hypothetical protein